MRDVPVLDCAANRACQEDRPTLRRLRHSPGTARLSETLREIVAITAAIGVAAGKGLWALTGAGAGRAVIAGPLV